MKFPVEHLERKELKELQSKRLREQVEYVEKKSKFYQKRFKEVGISSKAIQTIDDIRKLPFTYSDDLWDHYSLGMLCVPKEELQRIYCSSRSMRIPKIIGYTKGDVEASNEALKDRNLKLGEPACEVYLEQLSKKVEREIKKRVGITVYVKIHPEDTLPKNTGGKIDRILKKK